MANENCEHKGFCFFLRHVRLCIVEGKLLILTNVYAHNKLTKYFTIGKKYDVKNECTILFSDLCTV